MGVAVPISVGVPNHFKRHGSCSGLRPFGIFGVYKAETAYGVHYYDRMDAKAGDIAADLKGMSVSNDGEPLVLLCWCNLRSPGDWCHRRMAAAWLESHTGLTVPELGAVTPRNLYPTARSAAQERLFDG